MFEFLASIFSGAFGSLLAYFAGKKTLIPSAKDELEDLITLANNSTNQLRRYRASSSYLLLTENPKVLVGFKDAALQATPYLSLAFVESCAS